MSAFRYVAVICAAALATAASATLKVQINTDHPDRSTDYGGGVFRAVDFSTGGSSLPEAVFDTFCLEAEEYFTAGGVYNAQINTAAITGGPGGTPDPLDPRTAFLYYTYRTNPAALNANVSGGASFTGTQTQRRAATKQLQKAIWFLEQESGGSNNGLVALANASGWTDIGRVRVLNLFTLKSNGTWNHHQDQLILIPVPAPAAALLGVMGLGLAGWMKRRIG